LAYITSYEFCLSILTEINKDGKTVQAEKLFSEINQLLFCEDMSVLTIYCWSADWADYFHPGAGWWLIKSLAVYYNTFLRFSYELYLNYSMESFICILQDLFYFENLLQKKNVRS
jgi:hypothetical protein